MQRDFWEARLPILAAASDCTVGASLRPMRGRIPYPDKLSGRVLVHALFHAAPVRLA